MSALWLVATAMLVLALAVLLPPLLRDPRQHVRAPSRRQLYEAQLAELEADVGTKALDADARAQAIAELQRRLLDTPADEPAPRPARAWQRWLPAALISLVLPIAALLLYQQVGDPRAAAALSQEASAETHADDNAEAAAMIERLVARLRESPNDLKGWVVLARSYEFIGRFDDAVAAYRRALALLPDSAELWADYADALASAKEGDLGGEAGFAIQRALALDARQPKALALAATAAARQGDAQRSRELWLQLRAALPADSPAIAAIDAQLATLGAAPAAPAATARIAGTVSIAPALRDKLVPTATVFVVARPLAGGAPVAVLKLKATDLPARFELDDRLAMGPASPRLSGQAAVRIDVLASRSGRAERQSGDLVGTIAEVKLGRDDVNLQADRLVP